MPAVRTLIGTLPLILVATSVPARAEDLSQECQEQLRAVADPQSQYLCIATDANACHQTSTRVAPIFLGRDAAAVTAKKSEVTDFDKLYNMICRKAFQPDGTCEPEQSAVYQLFTNDDDTEQGHSFLVACVAKKGCAVLQGVAGAYGLRDWFGKGPKQEMPFPESKLLPGARDRYGKMKLLNGKLLHEWLSGVNDMANGAGSVQSVAAFWVCDNAYYKCKSIIDQSGKALPFENNIWRDTRWTRSSKGRVIGYRHDWDGQCKKLSDVREAGATYPSIYCTNDKLLTDTLKQKVNGLAQRNGMCVMGLGMDGAKSGYVLPNQELCESRGPMDNTVRFHGKGTFSSAGVIVVRPVDLQDSEGIGAPERITKGKCIVGHGGKSYEFIGEGNRENQFKGSPALKLTAPSKVDVVCRISGDAGHPVIQAPEAVEQKVQPIVLSETDKVALAAIEKSAKGKQRYSAQSEVKLTKKVRREKLNVLADKLKIDRCNECKIQADDDKWAGLEDRLLAKAKELNLF